MEEMLLPSSSVSGRLLTTAYWLPVDFSRLHTWELWIGGSLLTGLAVLVYKRHVPGAAWAVWVVAGLLPFVVLTETTILEMPAGPSRYLYPSSAGLCALLALGGEYGLRRGRRAGKYVGIALLLALVLQGRMALYQAQALFFYTSGRYHVSIGAEERAVDQFRQAIARGEEGIPLLDTYVRVANILLTRGEEVRSLLAEARSRLPEASVLKVLSAVLDAEAGGDPRRAQALARIDALVTEQRLSGTVISEYDLPAAAAVFFGNRGMGMLRAKDYEAAVVPLRHALRYGPHNRQASENLAFALYQTGRYLESGTLWLRLGQTSNATAAYGEALKKEPGNAEVRQLLSHLREQNDEQK